MNAKLAKSFRVNKPEGISDEMREEMRYSSAFIIVINCILDMRWFLMRCANQTLNDLIVVF